MSRRTILFCLLALAGAVLLCASGLVAGQRFELDRMFISFWSPPPTPERYAEVFAANFRVALGVTVDALPAAQKNRVLAVLMDPLLSRPWDKTLRSQELGPKLEAFVEKYREQPYVYGYFLADKPSAADFSALAEMAAFLKEKDPLRFSYINLFPVYATRKQLGTDSYEDYLDKFCRIVKPEILSYDHYHFNRKGDGRQYFLNLALVRKKALEYGIPFVNVIQACKTDPRRRIPTPNELRWLVWTSLAYGARGYVYFVYWGSPGTGGLMVDGKPTELYNAARQINIETINMTPVLLTLKSSAVYHAGEQPPGTEALPADGVIRKVSGGKFVVGLFNVEPNVMRIILVNADCKAPATAEVEFRRRINVAKAWDHHKAIWGRLDSWDLEEGSAFRVTLEPGDGRLMIVQFKPEG